jgi:hypothetical protein
MLQVYLSDASFVPYVCCIHVFHVARVLCYSEIQGAQGVMVARHEQRRIGRDELKGDGQCALGASGRGVWGQGARVGRGKRPQIKVDRVGCTCEASHPHAQAP